MIHYFVLYFKKLICAIFHSKWFYIEFLLLFILYLPYLCSPVKSYFTNFITPQFFTPVINSLKIHTDRIFNSLFFCPTIDLKIRHLYYTNYNLEGLFINGKLITFEETKILPNLENNASFFKFMLIKIKTFNF